MTCRFATRGLAGVGLAAVAVLIPLMSAVSGCGGGSAQFFENFGTPYRNTTVGGTGGSGPGNTGTGSGGLGGTGGIIDPCDEAQLRKFVRISMRNASPDDFIHYFFVLVAFVQSDTFPDGTVCPDDIPLYTSFGYVEIPEGQQQEFGSYCFPGPALVYFHRAGQFRSAGGANQLASAIAPAQGSQATYDNFFNSAGAIVPVPSAIIFHNPGTGEGAALKISRNVANPCAAIVGGGTGPGLCQQDAFYYVDEEDRLVGSTALGTGSGRRVPSEIQGTACECLGFDTGVQQLAPSNRTAANARCNEFLRGGRIDYVFIRNDTNPPIPQLVWRVTDASGGIAHNFDSRAQVP